MHILITFLHLKTDEDVFRTKPCSWAEQTGRSKNPKSMKMKQGESWKWQPTGVTTVVWYGKCDVLLLSTNSDPTSDKIVENNAEGARIKSKYFTL